LTKQNRQLWHYAVLGLALVLALGLCLFLLGDDGSKAAALGTTLVGSVVVGSVLIVFERGLAARTEAVVRTVSLAAAPTPARDVPEPTPSRPVSEASEERDLDVKRRRHFTVDYGGWTRDARRVDAFQLRLRVLVDGEYFQFFTIVIPGNDVTATVQSRGVTLSRFRRALIDVALALIIESIRQGEAPRADDPSLAIELRPSTDQARRLAIRMVDADYTEGDTVADFEL